MYIIQAGSADVTIYVRLRDSVTGLAETGLAFGSAGASCYYTRPRAAAAAITLVTLAAADSAHSDGGFKEVDATNAKGLYRLDLPDAAVAAGAGFVVVSIEFDGVIEESVLINLSPPVDAVAISGDTTAADNAEAFFDGTGYAGTNNVIPTVTTVNGLANNVITAAAIATGAIDADALAADAVGEIADGVWDEDIVAAHGTADTAGLIVSELTKRSVTFNTAVADGSVVGQLADDGTATYDRITDSLQAIRDRGDAAWTTGGGASITDILNVVALIPISVDLADTATWRLGLMLTNALDDLPSAAEITPGTISIDRKAQGGTGWTAVVVDAACSEDAGLVYYDEVFDAATGYAAGDSIRVTFKSQKITVAANDYEISDATGRIFYTEIRPVPVPAATIAGAVWDEARSGHVAAGSFGEGVASVTGAVESVAAGGIAAASFAAGAIDAAAIADNAIDAGAIATGAITAAKFGAGAIDAAAIADNAIDAGAIAANAITSAKIAADAIGASQLAADAVGEIADGVWDEDTVAAHGTADTAGLILSQLTRRSVTFNTAVADGSVIGQLADDGTATYDRTTDSLQAIADNVTASALTEAGIADAVWDEAIASHVTPGSTGAALNDVPDSVWDEVMETGAPSIAQTARQWMRLFASVLFGETANVGDWSAKSIDDSKTRVSATLTATGQRSSVDTLDGS